MTAEPDRLARLEQALEVAVARLAGLERLVGDALLGAPAPAPAPASAAPELAGRWLVVGVDGRRLGVPLDAVQEVVRMAALGPVPREGAGALEGLLDLRGAAVPALCLRRGLGLEPLEDDVDCRLVVLRARGGLTALRVDEVHGLQVVTAEGAGPPPERAAAWVAGVWRGEPFVLLALVDALVGALSAGAPAEEGTS